MRQAAQIAGSGRASGLTEIKTIGPVVLISVRVALPLGLWQSTKCLVDLSNTVHRKGLPISSEKFAVEGKCKVDLGS